MAQGSSGGGLLIDDETLDVCFGYMGGVLTKLDSGYSQYLAVLNGVLQNAVMEGDTADAIRAFTQSAAGLQGAYGMIRMQLMAAKQGFTSEVKAADRLSI